MVILDDQDFCGGRRVPTQANKQAGESRISACSPCWTIADAAGVTAHEATDSPSSLLDPLLVATGSGFAADGWSWTVGRISRLADASSV